MARKRRLGNAGDAPASVIKQAKMTRDAYKTLELHIVDGAPCRVESMVFAEAMGAGAAEELLGAGIYVLGAEDMRVRAPAM